MSSKIPGLANEFFLLPSPGFTEQAASYDKKTLPDEQIFYISYGNKICILLYMVCTKNIRQASSICKTL